jgi:hypothetical protein
VFRKNKELQQLEEVLADAPCLSCPQSLESHCDIEGCHKLTAWLLGGR